MQASNEHVVTVGPLIASHICTVRLLMAIQLSHILILLSLF